MMGQKSDRVDSWTESRFTGNKTDASKQSFKQQNSPQLKDEYHARVIDIWALGITIVIGGQYFNWNAGLAAGFGSYAIATFLIGTAYVCLCLCTSELSSALPFAGGGYGLARVTLGFYAGFMVGCLEILEYILYTADTCLSLGTLVVQITNMNPKYSPAVWLAFYVSAVTVYSIGGKFFWRVSNILAFLSITILLVYCFGCLKFVDFKYAEYVSYTVLVHNDTAAMINSKSSISLTESMQSKSYNNLELLDITNLSHFWFHGGFIQFMRMLPLTGWFYIGIESLNFASNDVSNPKRNIPISVMSCIATLFCTSVAILFISSSLPVTSVPMATSGSPLNKGFQLMFNITDIQATMLSIPATYATAFGFIFSYGRLIVSMSESRLLPRILRLKWGEGKSGTPYVAFIFGSIISYCVCIMVYFFPVIEPYVFNVCVLCAFLAYTSQFIGFINLRTRFADLPRLYRSPLGIFGALLGIVIFSLAAVSVIAFQGDNHLALVIVLFIAILNSLYYFLVAKHHQKFSRDELKTLFNAHVFKLNCRSNRWRLDRVQKSGNRVYKKSYDSDRNSFSGDEGYYDRNSSESLNAAMRSVVQRSHRHANNNNTNCENTALRGGGRVGEDQGNLDENSARPELNFGSGSAGTGPIDGVNNNNLVIPNDNMATASFKKIVTKSLPRLLFPSVKTRRVGMQINENIDDQDCVEVDYSPEKYFKIEKDREKERKDEDCRMGYEGDMNYDTDNLRIINGIIQVNGSAAL